MKDPKSQNGISKKTSAILTRARHDMTKPKKEKSRATVTDDIGKENQKLSNRRKNKRTQLDDVEPMKKETASVNTVSPKLTHDSPTPKLPSISLILGQDSLPNYPPRSYPIYPSYSPVQNPYISSQVRPMVDPSVSLGAKSLTLLQYSQSPPDLGPIQRMNDYKEKTESPETEIPYTRQNSHDTEDDLLPEVKSKSKFKIMGTHTFQSTQNKKLRKEAPRRDKKLKRWTLEEDDLIIYQKEKLKKSWKDIETLLESKHSWQAIQMRYLRCHKSRNNSWRDDDERKLGLKIIDDFNNRSKRLLIEMGPAFNPQRIENKIAQLAAISKNPLLKFYATEELMKRYQDAENADIEGYDEDEDDEDGYRS